MVIVLGSPGELAMSSSHQSFTVYSKTCLKRPLKKDKTKVLKTNGSLMKVKSIAECSLGAFRITFKFHAHVLLNLLNLLQKIVFFTNLLNKFNNT